MENNWRMFKCKSGEVLFYYNMITGEHRWSNGANIPQCEPDLEIGSSSVMTQLRTISTQTEPESPEDTQEAGSSTESRSTGTATDQFVKKSTIISLLTDIMVVLNNNEYYTPAKVFHKEPKIVIERELQTREESTSEENHQPVAVPMEQSGASASPALSVQCIETQPEHRGITEVSSNEQQGNSVTHSPGIQDQNVLFDPHFDGMGTSLDRSNSFQTDIVVGSRENAREESLNDTTNSAEGTSAQFLKSPLAVFEYHDEGAYSRVTLPSKRSVDLSEVVTDRNDAIEARPSMPKVICAWSEHDNLPTMVGSEQLQREGTISQQTPVQVTQTLTSQVQQRATNSQQQSQPTTPYMGHHQYFAAQKQQQQQQQQQQMQQRLSTSLQHTAASTQRMSSGSKGSLALSSHTTLPSTSQQPSSSTSKQHASTSHQRASTSHQQASSSQQQASSVDSVSPGTSFLKILDLRCPLCGLTSQTSKELRRHLNTHITKQNCCPICEKCYKTAAGLLFHLRNHTGDRPYSCETCNISFSCSSHLTQHFHTKRCHKDQSKKKK
ncbi:zinc finger protein 1 isoform X4 [Nematostella vectensis]|uniref:zinc finger protein 1 isoform X4 n=1 Tax=Nematostella vectensis TaxID=45351 RepID=UPI0013900AC8|nr:zinc finger protein 1 isoform X4 [Nematostella vectensis]